MTAPAATFEAWAARYGYDPTTDEARNDYADYLLNRAVMMRVFGDAS